MEYLPFGETLVDEHQNSYNAPYKFNGKELDAETNNYYYGIRYYNPKWNIWLSVDPHASSYPSLSGYSAFANNPIIYVDPDGRDIILAAGLSTKQKLQIVGNLQRLTNDKLVYSTLKDGTTQIKISSLGTENTGQTLNSGTNLIRTLNQKGAGVKTTTIDITTGGNKTTGKVTNAGLKSDGTANTGEDATVLFNPSKTTGGKNAKGSTTRPTEIGLGHELIHAKNRNTGTRGTGSSGKIDPDGSGKTLSTEEVNTRAGENKLRKEQGETLRKVPK